MMNMALDDQTRAFLTSRPQAKLSKKHWLVAGCAWDFSTFVNVICEKKRRLNLFLLPAT